MTSASTPGGADGSAATQIGAEGSNSSSADGAQDPARISAEFDSWMAKQSDDVRKIVVDWHESQLKPLKHAHERGKAERVELKAELERIHKDKSLDAEQKAAAIQEQLDKASRKAAFYENLPPEITDRAAALILAEHGGLIRSDGSCDFAKLKELHPALFIASPGIPGFAGKGTDQKSKPANDMNAWMRRSLKRQ
ncbi:MAG: hypothetical protein KJ050_10675 [Candidatus Omnitrophica bacterium]|nr:hypothetical protein [Candidatus Omnitrophota bacterium]